MEEWHHAGTSGRKRHLPQKPDRDGQGGERQVVVSQGEERLG
jgi:hypothetical protein